MVLSCNCLYHLFSLCYNACAGNNSVHDLLSKYTSLATRMAIVPAIPRYHRGIQASRWELLPGACGYFLRLYSTEEKKSSQCFWQLAGEATYSLLRSLCTPALPSSKGYDDLTTLLTNHLEPEPLVISERFHFHRRAQREDESVADFGAELRRLAACCSFQEAVLDETIRDRFVCGLRSEPTQRRLLTEKKLTLETAVNIALSMESADKPQL